MGEFAELYGSCRALGYCDCGGSNHCVDEVFSSISAVELERAVRANAIMSKMAGKTDTLIKGLASGFNENGHFNPTKATGYAKTTFSNPSRRR